MSKHICIIWHAGTIEQYLDRYFSLLKYFSKVSVIVPKGWHEYETVSINDERIQIIDALSILNFHQHFFLIKKLKRILTEIKPDILYIHEEPNSLITFQAARIAKKLNINSYVDSAIINKSLYLYGCNYFEQYVYRNVTGFFYRNDEVKNVLKKRGCMSEKILCQLSNGVSLKDFYKIEDFNRAEFEIKHNIGHEDSYVLGYAGRINKNKGVSLLDRFAKSNDVKVILAGKIDDQKLLDEIMNNEKVFYLGMLDKKSLNEFYNYIDLLVLPSIPTSKWVEQFGRVLTEAISAGTLVAGSDIGMIKEIVGEINVFKPENYDSFSAKVLEIKNSSDLNKRKHNQLKNVVNYFTWDSISLKFYNSIHE